MTRSKWIEPAVQLASAYQNATEIISRHVTALGGNYTEALVRIGTGEKQYGAEINQIAAICAGISNGIIAPEGGEVHILCGVLVDESVEWNATIDASCPNTPADYDVRKIGDSYPAKESAKPVSRTIVLVNFGKTIPNTDPVLAWSKKNKLFIASPRVIFAAVRKQPTIHKELGIDPMVIVSLEECAFSGSRHVPYAWLHGGKREASLRWPDNSFNGDCWFTFVRKYRSLPTARMSGRCFNLAHKIDAQVSLREY